jgi:hypothetical protein
MLAQEIEKYFTVHPMEKWSCKWTNVNTVKYVSHCMCVYVIVKTITGAHVCALVSVCVRGSGGDKACVFYFS